MSGEGRDRGREPWAIVALGATLVASTLAHPMGFGGDPLHVTVAETLLLSVAGVGTAFVGYRVLTTDDFDTRLRRRVVCWSYAGTAATVSAAVVVVLIRGISDAHAYTFVLQAAAGVGMVGGTIAGYNEGRAAVRAREAERARLRERQEREVRERIDFLNDLLRHDALNAAAVIEGYADLLGEHVEGEATRYVDTIAEQSRAITNLVDDVRILVDAIENPPELEAVDLAAIVEEEAASIERRRENIAVKTDVAGAPPVRADGLLGALLRNLLANAVEHHDRETAHVTVRAREKGERVVLEVADDGPGLPENVRPPFTPSNENHGRGLYLVETLVERYDGDLSVAENEPRGTVFRISLDAADDADDTIERGERGERQAEAGGGATNATGARAGAAGDT